MCGIAGIINFDKRPVIMEHLLSMTESMLERGPDDSGFFLSGWVGLGFRRLSIIDLAGGHQPISNENGSIQLVFNGEIYNHIELREELISRGHIFSTNSDAEVLIHLYEDKGVRALDEINGMFAFALYDAKVDEVWIVRDRLGIKPLYYVATESQFIFASDVRSIRAVFETDVDRDSIIKYLAHAYVPGRDTMWTGVKKLEPAHFFRINTNSADVKSENYWKPTSNLQFSDGELEARERIDSLLSDSISLQMRSDVPVGIFLSGGVDSSAIVSYAVECTNEPLRTYTINYVGKDSSDSRYAREVSKRYSTDHIEISVGPSEALRSLDELISSMDEPIADSAILAVHLISSFAKAQGVKVLLNGAGGDEIFGGYARHLYPKYGSSAWFAEAISRPLRKLLSKGIQLINSDRGIRASDHKFSWVGGVSGVSLSVCKKIIRDPADFKKLLSTIKKEYRSLDDSSNSEDYSYNRMLLDLSSYLPGDILSLTDKASMAASVECRVPLLDHRLVEFAFSLPSKINLLNGVPKGLFKQVLSGRLPEELLKRKKEGFNAPMSDWIYKSGALNLEDEFKCIAPVIESIIDLKKLQSILFHRKKNQQMSETIFSLILLNRWCLAQRCGSGK